MTDELKSKSQMKRIASQKPELLVGEIVNLREENKKLTYELEMGRGDLARIRLYHDEIVKLNAQLKDAIECLEYYADWGNSPELHFSDKAREFLERVK